MNKWILFRNIGQIDPDCLHILGASIKDTKNAIGEHGTGLKNIIAFMLRKNIPFHFYNGLDEIKVNTINKSLRGEDIELITINDQPTSISTKYGKKWEPWFVFREIYSNMIDEGCEEYFLVDSIEPEPMTVSVYLDYYTFTDVIENFNNYFSFKREPAHILTHGEQIVKLYHRKRGASLFYRRGIRCSEAWRESNYDYSIEHVEIDESRRAGVYDCCSIVSDIMLRHQDKFFHELFKAQRQVMNELCSIYTGEVVLSDSLIAWGADDRPNDYCVRGIVELLLDERIYISTKDEIAFHMLYNETILSICDKDIIVIPPAWFQYIESKHPTLKLRFSAGEDDYIVRDEEPLLTEVVSTTLDLCERFKWNLPSHIHTAKFKVAGLLGRANRSTEKIVISVDLERDRIPYIVFHELVHLQGDYPDGSNEREEFIFNLLK